MYTNNYRTQKKKKTSTIFYETGINKLNAKIKKNT